MKLQNNPSTRIDDLIVPLPVVENKTHIDGGTIEAIITWHGGRLWLGYRYVANDGEVLRQDKCVKELVSISTSN